MKWELEQHDIFVKEGTKLVKGDKSKKFFKNLGSGEVREMKVGGVGNEN